MMRIQLFFCLILLVFGQFEALKAQSGEWKYGFELGWSNSKVQGDLESIGGSDVETQKFNSGFHLSLYARRYYTDLFGVQFGLTYSQRGVRNEYDGPSYYLFGKQSGPGVPIDVNRVQSLKTLNGYLDIPVMAFHKIGERFEVGGGVYGGFLVVSKADGELRIGQRPSGGSSFETFFVTAENNYLKDNFGENTFGVQDISVDGTVYEEPRTIGAYYEYQSDPGENLYNTFDFGLIGQVGVYLSESLNVKGRFSYGLTDVTKSEADAARAALGPSQEITFRDDTDVNLSMQISLGFLF